MATARENIIEQACEKALEQARLHDPEAYEQMNSSQTEKLREAARKVAIETLTLTDEFKDKTYKQEDVAVRLGNYLSGERIQLIQDALKIQTFDMSIIKQSDNKHTVNLRRGDNAFMGGSRDLHTLADIDWAKKQQYASIVLEIIMLVMSAVGIAVDINDYVLKEATTVVAKINPKLLEVFIDAWNKSNGIRAQVVAIYTFIRAIYDKAKNIFGSIVSLVVSEMNWLEALIAIVEVTAMIIATFATDGVALIAKMFLALRSAQRLVQKIENINSFNTYGIALLK